MRQFRMFLFFIICISLEYASFSCKSNPAGPIDPPKNPSEYTWIADTLAIDTDESQMLMWSVWGTSANNIYTCGHTSIGTDIFWHYDGNKWISINKPQSIPEALELEIVKGTSANDIWIAGGKLNSPLQGYPIQATLTPFIARIDGQGNWQEYSLPHYKNVFIWNLFVLSPTDIWAITVGIERALFHFNGISWQADTISVPFNPNASPEILFYDIVSLNNDLYLSLAKFENNGAIRTNYIYKYNSNEWTCIDSSTFDIYKHQEPRFGNRLISTRDNKIISYSDFGMYEWNGRDWARLNTIGCSKIIRTSYNKLVALENKNHVYFFNGSIWQTIDTMTNPNVWYTDFWTDGKDAFIASYTTKGFPQKSIIWHGK